MGGVQPPKTLCFLRESFGMLLGSPPPLDVALISTNVAQQDNLCGGVCVSYRVYAGWHVVRLKGPS